MSLKRVMRYSVPSLGDYLIKKQVTKREGRRYKGWHNGSAIGVLQENGDLESMENTKLSVVKRLLKERIETDVKDEIVKLTNELVLLVNYKIEE